MPEAQANWRIVGIQSIPANARADFDCGKAPLNDYLRLYARQNDEKGIAKTWVALGAEGPGIVGYYSLSAAQVAFQELPDSVRRKLPAYPVPAVRLSRLAVDWRQQGCGMGEQLLGDAVNRAVLAAEQIGILLMVVDAKDANAAAFYHKYGFQTLPGAPLVLVMALRTGKK